MEEQIALWIAGFSYPAVFLLLVLCGVGAPLRLVPTGDVAL